MIATNRSIQPLRGKFDEIYASRVVGAGFFESDEYYRRDKERYWRSLELLCGLDIPHPAKILEIGGGQMAVLCKGLFNDECVVGDISEDYIAPLRQSRIPFVRYDLMDAKNDVDPEQFDVVILLEVIEHIPLPAYVLFQNIQRVLKPDGVLFVTTPNLFRLRNLVRMFLGIEFLDHFLLPEPEQPLGHQLEYSAEHLQWQFGRAGMPLILLRHDELGRVGHSFKARLARSILTPLRLRPLWRDGLVAAARKARPPE
jgi:SAM-dependent methyltransferase